MRRDTLYLALLICLAAVLRLDLLIANNFVIDADEAIVGLMAQHIVAAQDFPTFFYGQAYMGSLESICVAVLFYFFGSSFVALKIVPLFFSLILILLIYELALKSSSRLTARIAAFLCAFPPSALVVWSSMARGGFIEIVVIGAVSFLLLLKWLQSSEISLKLVANCGFVLGLGWWVNNQIIYFMLPFAFCMVARLLWWEGLDLKAKAERTLQVACTGLLSWLIGGLPYWIYNIQHHWASLDMIESASGKDVAKHFEGLYQTALPILLGASRFWQIEDTFPGSRAIIAILYFTLLLIYIFLRRRQIASLLIFKIDRQHCLECFFLFLISCSTIFVASSFGWLVQAPRYLLPMYVGIFVLSAFAIASIFSSSRRLGLIVFSIVAFCNLASSYWDGRSIPGEPLVFRGDRVSKDHTEIITWLLENRIYWIRTNYWIGYRLAFETKEQIKFIINQEPIQIRIDSWPIEAKKLNSDVMPLVMVPSQARMIRQALAILNYNYDEKVLSGYHVFYNIRPPPDEVLQVDSDLITASTEFNSEAASQAIDGLEETRWGSATHQQTGMVFTLALNEPTVIKAIRYSMGSWPQDFPRGLQIEFEKPNGERQVYFDTNGWEAVRYLLEMKSELMFYTKPIQISKIIFTQTKSHPIFDWSIAELELYK